jgi:hypothetical protein
LWISLIPVAISEESPIILARYWFASVWTEIGSGKRMKQC